MKYTCTSGYFAIRCMSWPFLAFLSFVGTYVTCVFLAGDAIVKKKMCMPCNTRSAAHAFTSPLTARLACFALCLCLLQTPMCMSQNLISNPSFETGSTTETYDLNLPTSWQLAGNTAAAGCSGENGYVKSGEDAWGGLAAPEGSYYFKLNHFLRNGESCSYPELSQTLNIPAYVEVTIAFDAAYRPNGYPTNLDVYIDGTMIRSLILSGAFVSRQVVVAARNVAWAGVFMLQNKPTSGCSNDCTVLLDNFTTTLTCAAGTSGTGASGCTPCPQGSYGSVTAGNGNTCTPCGTGYSTASVGTSSADASVCSLCALGYYIPPTTATVCAAEHMQICTCSNGRVYYGKSYVSGQPGSGTRCTFDQLKQYPHLIKEVSTSIECSNTNNGFGGDPNPNFYKMCFCEQSHQCTPCPQGSYGSATAGNGSTCTPCPQGSYGSATAGNDITCTPCGTGYSTAGAGTSGSDASACTVCAPGYEGTSGTGGTVGTDGCTPCAGLHRFYWSAGNGNTCEACPTGALVIAEGTVTIPTRSYIQCSGITSVVIPTSVTHIGDQAFAAISGLTIMNIPEGVIEIGFQAFTQSHEITAVTLPSTLRTIMDGAFIGMDKLSSMIIPEGVTVIPGALLKNCPELTSVTLPQSVTEIGESAFEGSRAITTLNLPPELITIGQKAFSNLNVWAASITVPMTVTSIGFKAFQNCNMLNIAFVCGTTATIDNDGTTFKGTNGCTDCEPELPMPSTITFAGTRSALNCDCDVGSYSATGLKPCTPCAVGYATTSTATTGSDAIVCTVCAAGCSGTSDSGSSGCTPCAQGSYGSATAGNGSTCTPCGTGYSTAGAGTSGSDASACTVCAVGYEGTSDSGTSGCVPGPCVAGKYGFKTGRPPCLNCGQGKYSDAVGATSSRTCERCNVGEYALPGSNTCTSCEEGYYSLGNKSVCAQCPAGRFTSVDQSTCLPCPGGTFSAAGASICTNCEAGKYSFEVSSQCTACARNTYNPFLSQTSCKSCPDNSYSDPGASACNACHHGKFSHAGGDCESCAAS